MAVYPQAHWEPLPANSKQARMTPRVVIIHRAVDAAGKTDLYGWFVQSGLESHFFVQLDGTVLQYMDTAVVAEANYKANGFAVSIETEDDGSAIPFTGAQLDAIVRLVDWLCSTHNIPRRQADRWDGSGIGWHSMWGLNTKTNPGVNPWTSALGKDCPSGPRIAQTRDVIIPRVAGHQVEEDVTKDEFMAWSNEFWDTTRFPGRLGNRNLRELTEEVGARTLYIDDRTRAMEGALGDDETKILTALAGTQGALLLAIASLPAPGQMTPEQITDLTAQLKDGLGDEVADEVGRRLTGATA